MSTLNEPVAETGKDEHAKTSFKWPDWFDGLREDGAKVFFEQWSPYVAALALVIIVVALMGQKVFWGVFGGFKLWGDYFNTLIGLAPALGIAEDLDSLIMHKISLMNIALIIGAAVAALISRQFRINPAPKLEYVWGAVGGTLMGLGAVFAGGCNVGGFFTPLIFGSPTGWVMLIGLIAGAWIGLKIMLWGMENIEWGTQAPPQLGEMPGRKYFPWAGLAITVLIGLWVVEWITAPDAKLAVRATIILGGFAIGFVMHRSRFCMSRVVREPLMTGEGDMTKAFMLAVLLGVPVGSILLSGGVMDPYLAIPARFWIGSLAGGLIFGIGMVLAGGCATGTLWRMGEGHMKLWTSAFFFAWSGSTFHALMKKTGLTVTDMNLDMIEESALGIQAHWPAMLGGWGPTYAVTFVLLAVWYLLVTYNERTGRFTIF